jgi:hypothetical protein
MRFFNKYTEEDNFRLMGFHIFKTIFGFGFSFGKPIWWIPKLAIIVNDDNKILKLKFGWLLFCCGIQILHGFISTLDTDGYVSVPPKHIKYVKTKYIYKGKGKPLPYTRDI